MDGSNISGSIKISVRWYGFPLITEWNVVTFLQGPGAVETCYSALKKMLLDPSMNYKEKNSLLQQKRDVEEILFHGYTYESIQRGETPRVWRRSLIMGGEWTRSLIMGGHQRRPY